MHVLYHAMLPYCQDFTGLFSILLKKEEAKRNHCASKVGLSSASELQ